MTQPRTQDTLLLPIEFQTRDQTGPRNDLVAVEAPLEVRFHGHAVTVLMRTPGHDEDLVRGFLFCEGIIRSVDEIECMLQAEQSSEEPAGTVIDVHFRLGHKHPGLGRFFYRSASCGVCGKNSIASLEIDAKPLRTYPRIQSELLSSLPDTLRASQMNFEKTGGVHASGLFRPDGELIALREDVGRHNALDKLIGWALVERLLPLDNHILVVSGRVSFELVQKAVVASIPVLAAVGAPTSLAVELANRFELTLVGFLRPASMNVYANFGRIRF